jgi:acetolactate synthase-1/2/3 large subunit
VADCFGIPYILINESSNLENQLKELFAMKGAVICEIIANENQEHLHDTYARNSQKRIVYRAIEDLYPFMDRELFLSEMIIEPIDK